MIPRIPATASALQGLQACLRRMDRDAAIVARSGLEIASPSGPPVPVSPGPGEPDLTGAMVDLLVVHRAFSAQLRVLETADEMSGEATRLGESTRRDR